MPATFTPPIELQNPPVLPDTRGIARRLFRYLGPQPVGLSVVGPYPNYRTVQTPDQLLLEGLADGIDYFLGGHEYVVSDEVADALAGSGYPISIGGYVNVLTGDTSTFAAGLGRWQPLQPDRYSFTVATHPLTGSSALRLDTLVGANDMTGVWLTPQAGDVLTNIGYYAMPILASTGYRFRAAFYSPAAARMGGLYAYRFTSAGTMLAVTSVEGLTSTAAVTTLSGTFTSEPTATYASLVLQVQGSAETHYADSVYLEVASP